MRVRFPLVLSGLLLLAAIVIFAARAEASHHPGSEALMILICPLDTSVTAAGQLDGDPFVLECGGANPRIDVETQQLVHGGFLSVAVTVRKRGGDSETCSFSGSPRSLTIQCPPRSHNRAVPLGVYHYRVLATETP